MYSSVTMSSRPLQQYTPSAWGDLFLRFSPLPQKSKVKMENEAKELKKEVKMGLIASYKDPIEQLEYIDAIERLGVSYHFESEIEEVLEQMYDNFSYQVTEKDDLYHASLRFRILRQHGFTVPSDVMRKFKDGIRGFKSRTPSNNVEGMLSLYEASYVLTHEDDILEEARRFTTTFLRQNIGNLSPDLAVEVASALHQPLHRGTPRAQTRKFLSLYENRPSHHKTLNRFAKLEFNLLQSLYQKELRDMTEWWKSLYAMVPFMRDRLVETYFGSTIYFSAPENGLGRKIVTKLYMVLIIMLDDLYDSYGTLQELELFTEALHRWDEAYIAQCSQYCRGCYQATVETIDEIEQDLVVQGRSEFIHYLKSEVQRLCRAYLQEARWRESKKSLTYEEYMEVGVESISATVGNVIAFLGISDATKAGYEWVCQDPMPKFVRALGVQSRLMNDIAGRKLLRDKGNPVTSVECYMRQHGISEEDAYNELNQEVEYAWKDLNEGLLRPHPIPQSMLIQILNFARAADVYYMGGREGFTMADSSLKHDFASTLLHPLPL